MSTRSPVCPLCGSDSFIVQRKRGELEFGRCAGCDLAYVNPLETDEDAAVAAARSSRTHEAYNQGMTSGRPWRPASATALGRRRLRYYEQVMHRRPRSILDVGCGDGVFAPVYEELGVEWTGVDVNPDMVRYAAEHHITILQEDFCSLNPGRTYDVVFASQVLEHTYEPNRFVRKAKELLSPDGLVHMDVPNHDGLASVLRKLNPYSRHYGFLQMPYHRIAYSAKSLAYLFRENGFEPVVLGGLVNDHPVFGQLRPAFRPATWLYYRAAELWGREPLLIVVARHGQASPCDAEPSSSPACEDAGDD